jgi:hypothetical protein
MGWTVKESACKVVFVSETSATSISYFGPLLGAKYFHKDEISANIMKLSSKNLEKYADMGPCGRYSSILGYFKLIFASEGRYRILPPCYKRKICRRHLWLTNSVRRHSTRPTAPS